VGSTNVKTVLLDDAGKVLAGAERPIATRRSGVIAEQDPEEVWQSVAGAVREAAAGSDAAPGAVVCCSQYSSIVPVDASGRPTADLVMYWDLRGGDDVLAILGQEEAFETWSGTRSRRSVRGSRSRTSCTSSTIAPTCTPRPPPTSNRWTS
jgi:xylulokinase